MHRFLLLLPLLLGTSCGKLTNSTDCSPAHSVSRQETLAIAEHYRTHKWTATEKNILHGKDSDGIRVDTPDSTLTKDVAIRPGWWVPNKVNEGIPYQWGGFDTPSSFDRKLRKGYYAGDVYTELKRAQLENAVSRYACGIDCSGFISRCWRLDRAYSTRELPQLCTPLASYDELKPGDILNKHNSHALLFCRFINSDKSAFLAYETGSPPTWKVLLHPLDVGYVKSLGYEAYRYKKIKD